MFFLREAPILGKLKETITSGREEAPQKGFLRPIDVEKIARQVNLDKNAAQAGRLNFPAEGSKDLDDTESAIVNKVLSEYHWQVEEFINQLRSYAVRLNQFSIKSEFEKLELRAKNTISDFRTANRTAEADLGTLREYFVEVRNELNEFRMKHRLKRPARRAGGRWTTFGLMLLLISFESVLNGVFFSKGSEFGLIGGIGTAIGISFVNVIIAFLLGWVPTRWVNHRNLLLKLIGVVTLLVGTCGLVVLQGFAGHFREATALVGEDQAFARAQETIVSTPFGLNDINSYYLVGLGLVFGLLAFIKGVSMDDPYPGYGDMFRRFEVAMEEYRDVHSELFDNLEDLKEDTVTELKSGMEKLPYYPQTAAGIDAQRSALVQNFRTYEASISNAINQLLKRYRRKNKESRDTPEPEHFDKNWEFLESATDAVEARKLLAVVPESDVDVDAPLQGLAKRSEEVLQVYEAMVAKYPHPTEIE